MLNRELTHLSETSRSGNQVSEYISQTFLGELWWVTAGAARRGRRKEEKTSVRRRQSSHLGEGRLGQREQQEEEPGGGDMQARIGKQESKFSKKEMEETRSPALQRGRQKGHELLGGNTDPQALRGHVHRKRLLRSAANRGVATGQRGTLL